MNLLSAVLAQRVVKLRRTNTQGKRDRYSMRKYIAWIGVYRKNNQKYFDQTVWLLRLV